MLDIMLTQNARKWPSRGLVADTQKLRSETRWSDHEDRELRSMSSERGDIREIRTFDEFWISFSTFFYT